MSHFLFKEIEQNMRLMKIIIMNRKILCNASYNTFSDETDASFDGLVCILQNALKNVVQILK